MSGLARFEAVKAEPGSRRVQFITVNPQGDAQGMKQALEQGVSACLTKPLRFDAFRHKVFEILCRRLPFEI